MADSLRSHYLILGLILAAIVAGLTLILWPDRASDTSPAARRGTTLMAVLTPNSPRELFDLESGTSTIETETTVLADYDIAFQRTVKPDPSEPLTNRFIEEDRAMIEPVSAIGLADIGTDQDTCNRAGYINAPVTLFNATELQVFEPNITICVKTRNGKTARLSFAESANEFIWNLD